MEQKITQPWIKGLIVSLILIIYGIVLYFTGQSQNKSLGLLQLVILVIGLIISCIVFAKQQNGNVTFGNVFAHGFKTTAAIIVIMVLYTVVSINFLFPEMIDLAVNQARIDMEKRGDLNDDQITQAIQMSRKFFTPFAIGGIVLGFGIIDVIASLIGAGVAKKNPNYNPLEQ